MQQLVLLGLHKPLEGTVKQLPRLSRPHHRQYEGPPLRPKEDPVS
jgi:hypothetical protein